MVNGNYIHKNEASVETDGNHKKELGSMNLHQSFQNTQISELINHYKDEQTIEDDEVNFEDTNNLI